MTYEVPGGLIAAVGSLPPDTGARNPKGTVLFLPSTDTSMCPVCALSDSCPD